jgi:hypothetical protein
MERWGRSVAGVCGSVTLTPSWRGRFNSGRTPETSPAASAGDDQVRLDFARLGEPARAGNELVRGPEHVLYGSGHTDVQLIAARWRAEIVANPDDEMRLLGRSSTYGTI